MARKYQRRNAISARSTSNEAQALRLFSFQLSYNYNRYNHLDSIEGCAFLLSRKEEQEIVNQQEQQERNEERSRTQSQIRNKQTVSNWCSFPAVSPAA